MCRNLFKRCSVIIFIIPALLFLSGCAVTKKVPIYQSPTFTGDVVDEITIFPVVDLRIDKSTNPTIDKVDEWVITNAERILKKYGYNVNVIRDRTIVSELTELDLSSKDAGWIKHVAPTSSNWILVIGLVDCMAKLTFGSTGNAEVTGYLYNKAENSIIWHDKGVGQTGQGGLMGMAMKGMMAHDAIVYATSSLMVSIPKKSK